MAATGLDDLPDAVIDEILARLPTRDAVRTSALSRSWCNRWKSVPDLDLSSVALADAENTIRLHTAPVRHFKLQIAPEEYCLSRSLFAALVSRSSISLRTIDISLWTDGVCAFRLSTFALWCPRLTLIKLTDCDINKLECTTSFPELRTLDITGATFYLDSGFTFDCFSMQMYIPPCPNLENLTLEISSLRCDINTIGRDFPRLTHLKLGICDLNIVPAALASLHVLHLIDVDVDGQLSVLFSSCPSLERLSLRKVSFLAEKHLHVGAPNLRWLELVEVRQKGYCLYEFSITCSPVLETVLIGFGDGFGELVGHDGCDLMKFIGGMPGCNLMKFLGGMPRVKKLTLNDGTIKFLRVGLTPEKLPTSLERLTHLSADVDFNHLGDASVVLCLMRSAPNLQEAHFKSWTCELYFVESCEERENFWKAQEHMYPFDNLKTVTMNLIRLSEDEFELEVVQFVLSKAPVLETMTIELIDDRDQESAMKTVLEFPKASLQAQIVFPRL